MAGQPRAFARVTYNANGTPTVSGSKGFSGINDVAVGRARFTLDRAIDRTEACVLCSFLGTIGAGGYALAGGTIDADIGIPAGALDTTVEVRMRQSSGALADPGSTTGFYLGVFDGTQPG